MRANAPSAQHGIVLNLTPSYPASEAHEDEAAAARFDGFFNRWFLDPLLKGSYPKDMWEGYGNAVPVVQEGDLELFGQPLDFLGVNYYSRAVVAHAEGDWPNFGSVPAGEERTDMGWEVFPEGLTDLLVRLKQDYAPPPLYITENGAAYADSLENGHVRDTERVRYYARHLVALQEAIRQGVDVRGYYAWSLMDNFEWAKGYSKRFGLVYVDYATQERTLKESGRWYGEVARSGGRALAFADD
jgi:beta-glucosidase